MSEQILTRNFDENRTSKYASSNEAVPFPKSGMTLNSKYFATRPDSVGRALRMMKVSIIGDASSSAKRPSVCAVSPMTRRLSPLGD